ncbi:MAG: c-type cytochrome, partial [Elusimicrobia bacterium]|nr:c-type cytochrome [Elusimicrobiota bacterium]
MKRFLAPAALVLAAVAMVLAVRRDLQEPHWRLFNDMVYSKAYKSQMPNSVLPGGRTEQPPVPGTIPRGYMPLPYGPGAAGRELAGRELKNPLLPTYQNLIQGKQLFQAYCSHCHGQEGLGDGPVAKLFPAFSFPIATPSVYALKDGTIFDVITYGFNMMPAHGSQIPQKDRWKIILYLRNLQRQEIARHAYPRSPLEDSRRDSLVSAGYGKELFAQHCAVCHGQEGLHPQHGVPTLHQPSVLAVADNNYYRQTITHGRAGTAMPAWGGALTPTQIESLVRYIRSWATPAPSAASLVAARGDAVQGKALFAKRCAGCHGRNGQGGIGNSLNGPAFLSIASKRFLRETIAWGRPHTAMPAAYGLKASDVADLSAAIQSWRSRPPSWSRVQRLLPRVTNAQGARV